MPASSGRGRRAAVTLLAFTALGALTFAGIPQGVARPTDPQTGGDAKARAGQRERKVDYDARVGSVKQQLTAARDTVQDRSVAQRALTKKLGTQGVVSMDAVTGTPSSVGRLDGFLTGRSTAAATTVALRYVKANLAGLNLTRADLSTLRLRQDYVDVAGIHHISWTQSANGIPVFGNGLKANVTKAGQLISLQGAPVSGLAELAAKTSTAPALTAAQARAAAAKDVGGRAASVKTTIRARLVTRWANHDQAQLVWFATSTGLRLGWSTYVQAGGNALNFQHVIDASTARVLYRHDAVDSDRTTIPADPAAQRSAATQSEANQAAANKGNALVYNNYPGARVGGKQQVYNLITQKMLPASAKTLSGNYVVAWADVNDNDRSDAGETVPVPGATGASPQFRLVKFNGASDLCSNSYICTWDPNKPLSWTTNKNADVTQGFYFDSVFHNYLLAKPFGFTPAAGNFEAKGGDPIYLNSLDGANTGGNGLPDANHIDNANMSTPPDGTPPTMQMYLFHAPGATDTEDPFIPTSSSFDASIIFHEYTHGLSNRLVVDAAGNSTLSSVQAGSMGEAWSDYYAEDYLVTKGYEKNTSAPGDVLIGKYVTAGKPFRTMGIDCPVVTTSKACTPLFGNRTGGYTYGDFTRIIGFPEEHASGEIWGQTLWDLRARLGHTVTAMLVTRAMELSPADPSFLDMRNSILQADLAVYGGKNRNQIWRTFANRGMGFFAGTLGSGDAQPVEDFSTPPSPGSLRATVHGKVTNKLTGQPVAKALVSISGHDSGFVGDYAAVTDAKGRYSISGVFVGRYPLVVVYAPGYTLASRSLKVPPRGVTANFTTQRDWAASSGGGSVVSFDGPDYTDFGCGPNAAIDLSQGTGWGSTTGDDQASPTNVMIPKSIVVKLPKAITLSSFSVDPSNTCGDDTSAATAGYRIDTSTNGTSWTTARSGTFTAADLGKFVALPVAKPIASVRYVRFTILSNQTPSIATNCPAGQYSGCYYTDLTELAVFGLG